MKPLALLGTSLALLFAASAYGQSIADFDFYPRIDEAGLEPNTAGPSALDAQDTLHGIVELDKAELLHEPPLETSSAPAALSFDAERIAALLKRAEPAAAVEPGLTMTEIDALRQQVSRCWNLPDGAAGAEMLVVKLSVQLNPDGSLTADPELVDVTQSPFSQVAAEAAMRAVSDCQPYALPAEKYRSWRHLVINFDPRAMLGG